MTEANQKNRWIALYTKPRHEKQAAERFNKAGYLSYVPINKIKKQWSDRKKWVDEVLIKGYVFVYTSPLFFENLIKDNSIINFVRYLGKIASIPDSEIENLKNFCLRYRNIKVENTMFNPKDKVLIKEGVFEGKEAEIEFIQGNKVTLRLNVLQINLTAEVMLQEIEKIDLKSN
jgi:transcription antitermination factor NusG